MVTTSSARSIASLPSLRLLPRHGASFVREVTPSLAVRSRAKPRRKKARRKPTSPSDVSGVQTAKLVALPELTSGLSPHDMHGRLVSAQRLREVGLRALAFYLDEMLETRAWQALGCSSVAHYADERLGMDRDRVYKLANIGKALRSLPRLDAAVRAAQVHWSKAEILLKVISPLHEEAWVAEARKLSCRALRDLVRRSKQGAPPNKPGSGKGIPTARFPVDMQLEPEEQRLLEQMRAKLSDELDRPVTIKELFLDALQLLDRTEADGSVPGRRPVKSHHYKIHLHQGEFQPDGSSTLSVDLDDGPLPVATLDAPDIKTPEPMRRHVLERDRATCRRCASRERLQVHHVIFRQSCGPTHPSNLATLCRRCHGLLHDGYIVARGRHAATCVFEAKDQAALDEIARRELEALAMSPIDDAVASPAPSALPMTLDDVPDEADASWLVEHAAGLRRGAGGALRLVTGYVPTPVAHAEDAAAKCRNVPTTLVPGGAENRALAFAGIHGHAHAVRQIEVRAQAAELRGRPFPHALFVGPAGTGKTTLAEAVTRRMGARLVRVIGGDLDEIGALVGLLAKLGAGDVLFIDEIHAVPRRVLEVLYQAMTDRRLPITISQGERVKALSLRLPEFTLLAATTEEMEVPSALRSRFQVLERLGALPSRVLADIGRDAAATLDTRLADDAALLLGRAAQGSPREVLRLAASVCDFALVQNGPTGQLVDAATMRAALEHLGIDERGLDADQRRYLAVIGKHRGPATLGRLAALLHLPEETVRLRIEPYLMHRGLVRVGPAGREPVRG